jgi:serine/threonine protein kinase
MLTTQTGTPYYCSPEVWNEKPYDYKCDIWSLGCMFLFYLECRDPNAYMVYPANDNLE